MSSSAKIDDREKDILILGKSPIQVLEHTLTAQKLYSINFTENNKIFFLSFHYNGGNNYLLMVHRLLNSKQRILTFQQIIEKKKKKPGLNGFQC